MAKERFFKYSIFVSMIAPAVACSEPDPSPAEDSTGTSTFSTGSSSTATHDSSGSNEATSSVSTTSSTSNGDTSNDSSTTSGESTTSSGTSSTSDSSTSTESTESSSSSGSSTSTESSDDSGTSTESTESTSSSSSGESTSSSTSSTESTESTGSSDSTDSSDSDTDSSEERKLYSAGHGDILFEYNNIDDQIEIVIRTEGATVDGVLLEDITRFDPDELIVMSNATFTRPEDNGFFEPICVDIGESVFWLPQTNSDASGNSVPFLGIASGVNSGDFVNDQLRLELISIDSPSGSGHYTMWKDGFQPNFPISSCDGISASDGSEIPIGHDHYNMGFADDPGNWHIRYEVSGQKQDNSERKTQFTIHYRMQARQDL